jgi:uncharacterized protein (DUF1684 family)
MTDTIAESAAALASFHRGRRSLVAGPAGSLALVNTQWVDSPQPVYGVPGVWSPLAAGESGLRVRADASDGITVDGVLVDGDAVVRGMDSAEPGEVVFSATVTGSVIASEQGSYGLRVWDAGSESVQRFGSIDAFDYNPEWVLTARFTELPGGSTVGFEHLQANGATGEPVVPGEVTFEKDGSSHTLAAFSSGNRLQLVFADATNGESTYSVGRFLFAEPSGDGTITLDFNRSVLPPCAFSYNFNCPIPPQQNRLAVAIEAGEKNVLSTDGSLLH